MKQLKVIFADLDDIVFENRNKAYGAYDLRKRENRNLLRGALIAFFLFLMAFYGPYLYSNLFAGKTLSPKVDNIMEVVHILEKIDITKLDMEEEKNLALEALPAPAIERPTISLEFLDPNPVPDDYVDEEANMTDVDELNKFDGQISFETNEDGEDGYENLFTNIDDGPGSGIIDDPIVVDDPSDTDFVFAERQPKAVNMDSIKGLIGYPSLCKEAELEGKVVVRLKISKSGLVKDAIVIRNPHPCLTKAVMNHVKNLVFRPALQAYKPVVIWVNQEFKFTLTN